LNEERRIGTALRSVHGWVDEIIVVDMDSDDRTVEIARSFGARVFRHDRMGYADPARGFAVAQASGDWVLILDADELVTPALSQRLIGIARSDEADVVAIPRVNYLLGRPLRHTGWGPEQDRHDRFFKPSYVELRPDVHAYLRVLPAARRLELGFEPPAAIIHFNYATIEQFLERSNRYTAFEADRLMQVRPTSTPARALAAAAREFLRRYIRLQGFRDGWRGFYLSGLMASYRFAVHAKARERRAEVAPADIEGFYASEAERWLLSGSQVSSSGSQPNDRGESHSSEEA